MWTPEQHAQAIEEGWKLVTVFDNGDTRPLYHVVDHGPRFPNAKAASAAVIEAAKCGGALHQHALRLVLESRRQPPTSKEKK